MFCQLFAVCMLHFLVGVTLLVFLLTVMYVWYNISILYVPLTTNRSVSFIETCQSVYYSLPLE